MGPDNAVFELDAK